MGTGISTACGSKRSVLISNSVRKLPTIPENDVDSDVDRDLETGYRSGKLHTAESRDSGIGENDVPNGFMFTKNSGKGSSSESSPEKGKDIGESGSSRVSRPQSCRLGHRGHHGNGKSAKKAELSDSQIRRMVRSARGQPGVPLKSSGDLSDDTLSNASSPSPTRENRPKSARRRNRTRSGRDSAKTISDLDTSTDTDVSDTDMLSIPDETGAFSRGKQETPKRRGWVQNEDFTDVMLSSSFTPRVSGGPMDMYRIVSGTHADYDLNLAKKASERSISSIILTPMDGTVTPTNSEWFDPSNDMFFTCGGISTTKKSSRHFPQAIKVHVVAVGEEVPYSFCPNRWRGSEQITDLCNTVVSDGAVLARAMCYVSSKSDKIKNLEDLVSSLVVALDRQRFRGPCTATDYENVMKSLRYQLVGMAMGYVCNQATPRIEVKGSQKNLFTEDSWKVQIRLRTQDEEVIESSEHILAERLAAKGQKVTREDIQILLAEHLKTIERIQQVKDSEKVDLDNSVSNLPNTSRTLTSNKNNLINQPKRPESASKVRKLNSGQKATAAQKLNLQQNSKSKGDNSGETNVSNNLDCVPERKGGYSEDIESITESPESSPDFRSKNKLTFNESGIDSDQDTSDAMQHDEEGLYNEFMEAVRILWDTLTPQDLGDLLKEFRRRESYLTLSGGHMTDSSTNQSGIDKRHINHTTGKEQYNHGALSHKAEEEIACHDEKFVLNFIHNQSVDGFLDQLTGHMKKTRLIRVQSFTQSESGIELTGNQRSNSFTGFGSQKQTSVGSAPNSLKRQHSFSGAVPRQNSLNGVLSRQNSFVRSLPNSRQGSYCSRSRSRGSTGSSNTYSTYSTTSSGISSGHNSELSDSSASYTSKSALSRECSYGLLNEFEDIEELDEELKTARDTARENARKIGQENIAESACDSLRPPSGRRSNNGLRATSGNIRDRENRRGQMQVHGLGHSSLPTENTLTNTTVLRKIDEDVLPKVEENDAKVPNVRSRPDSGIAVSMSSASYSSSEPHKERDLEEPYLTMSCQEMVEKVSKVPADQHNDVKSLVAAVTKGLHSEHTKAQALYCWLTSQDIKKFEKISKKSSSPPGRLKQLLEKRTTYASVYIEMLKVAGLKCERVEGYVKNKDYLPGNTVQTQKFQHSWVAVSMDSHYRLVDPQLGSSGEKFDQDHYFATSPDELILSHFPKDKKWLLMNTPATVEEFEGHLKTWPAMFHFVIRPLNMKSVIRTYDGRLSITVLLQNVAVNPQLEYAGPGKDIDISTLEEKIDHEIRDVDNAETYHVTLPQEGNYYFTVYAHVLEDCVDVPVFQYRIEYVDELL